jgi:LAO/AO transport system kinase
VTEERALRSREPAALVGLARAGDRAALARALTIVERGGADAHEIGRAGFGLGGHAYTLGMTGAPGAGKSTLTSALIAPLRAQDRRVAVLAVDPSSPFSGGAILGDRVRMGDHVLDPGVFIRSMATRGHLGGLSLATPEAIRLLDAAGTDLVIVETVGVGQVEVEVAGAADTTIVVVNPGWGDTVQANKAGLMEIADLFVVNKADRDGSKDTMRDLEQMLDLSAPSGWRPPVLCTVASRAEGVDELLEALERHRAYLGEDGRLEAKREQRLRHELHEIVTQRLRAKADRLLDEADRDALEAAMLARRLDPWTAADQILAGIDA